MAAIWTRRAARSLGGVVVGGPVEVPVGQPMVGTAAVRVTVGQPVVDTAAVRVTVGAGMVADALVAAALAAVEGEVGGASGAAASEPAGQMAQTSARKCHNLCPDRTRRARRRCDASREWEQRSWDVAR